VDSSYVSSSLAGPDFTADGEKHDVSQLTISTGHIIPRHPEDYQSCSVHVRLLANNAHLLGLDPMHQSRLIGHHASPLRDGAYGHGPMHLWIDRFGHFTRRRERQANANCPNGSRIARDDCHHCGSERDRYCPRTIPDLCRIHNRFATWSKCQGSALHGSFARPDSDA